MCTQIFRLMHVCLHMNTHTYKCIYACMYVCMHVCMHADVFLLCIDVHKMSMYVHAHIYTDSCMPSYIYTYINT